MNDTEIVRELKKKIIIFDTETTGIKPGNICQLSYLTISENGIIPKNFYFKVKYIEPGAQKVHGLTVAKLRELSKDMDFSAKAHEIHADFTKANMLVGHNVSFDIKFLLKEFERNGLELELEDIFCTMKKFTNFCKIPKRKGVGFKWPRLDELAECLSISQEKKDELSRHLFGLETFAHDARGDIISTYLCFIEGMKKVKS